MSDQAAPLVVPQPGSAGAPAGVREGPPDESIAVVIPVYNGEAYLAEALASVLRQTLPANEILVIIDGSRDDSAAIARGFPGVRVIEQQNAGVSAARNNGVGLSSSAWIAFLDQDDQWEPEKLERQMEALRNTPGADVCLSSSRVLRQIDGTEDFRLFEPGALPASHQIRKLLYTSLRPVPSCVVLRRSLFLQVGGFESSAQPCEDWDLWLRMEQAGAKFTAASKAMMIYRLHSANGSNDGQKMFRGELRAFERRIAPRLPAWLRPLARLRAQSRFLAGLALVDREQKLPHLGSMLRSIVTFPFGYWKRYKVAVYMALRSGKP